jgi:tetratricopeptide (TPR) repeat protein
MPLPKAHKFRRTILWQRQVVGEKTRFHPFQVVARKAAMLKLGGKWDASLSLWTANLQWSESLPDPGGELAESLLETGWLWFKKGDYQKALELYGRGEACCKKVNDGARLNSFWSAMGTVHLNRGEYDQARDLFDQSLEISRRSGNSEELARSLNNQAMLHWDKGDYQECLRLHRQTRELYIKSGNEVKLAQLLGNMALAYWGVYDFGSARQLLNEGLALSKKTGDMQTYALTTGNLAGIMIQEGEFKQASELINVRLEFAARFGDNKNRCVALGQLAQIEYLTGDYRKAELGYLRALEAAETLGLKYYKGYFLTMLTETAWALKDIQNAGKYLGQASELVKLVNVAELKFNVRKLGARLAGPAQGGRELQEMLDQGGWDPAQQADLHYESYLLTGSAGEREKALQLYREILQKAPLHEYQQRVKELSK